MKRWKHILTAGTLSVGLLAQSIPVLAADGMIKNGSFHVDQFGKYDILAAVEVNEGRISDVKITGENFSGTYAEMNKEKLSEASEGMTEQLKGLSASDGQAIMETDTVSGATVSSNGIKSAVFNALGLEKESDSTGALDQVPEAGEYEVKISVKSDVVEHSLVGEETATAGLHVDENGKMQLSYTIVSGTEKEPMYVLEFNGYYPENDRSQELTMDGATVKKETKNKYTVATEVSVPLSNLSGIYYANSKIYVPAMSNVNGLISGVNFENGTFDVDNEITVYWDTLKSTEKSAAEDMEITAVVEETPDSPSYSVVIPAAVSMGKISGAADNTIGYEITVHAGEKDREVTVSAPTGGELYKEETQARKKESLAFTNDFGRQTVKTDVDQDGAIAAGDHLLKGNIRISAEEVRNASAGTYSGTTVFTIQYKKAEENPNPTTTPEPTATPTPAPDANPDLDRENLADGVYSITGVMVKVDKNTYSMSNDAISHTIKLTVKNGTYFLTLNFNGLTVGQKLGYLSQIRYFTTGYTQDSYGNPQGTLADTVVESYQKNVDGTLVSDSYGTNYPDLVTFEMIPEAKKDGYLPLQIVVPIMESISQGTGTQPVYLKLDWSTLKKADSDDPGFDDDNKNNGNNNNNNNNNSNGTGNIGNNTLGNSSLGKSSLKSGTSSLGSGSSLKSGTSSLGSSSKLKAASSVNTGDEVQNNIVWMAVLLLGCTLLAAGCREYRKKKRGENHEKQKNEK